MAKPTKFLFLDIDGVLNSHRTILVNDGVSGHSGMPHVSAVLDPIALGLIKRIAHQGVTIVLSSTWRIGLGQHSLRQLGQALDLRLSCMTPINEGSNGVRGDEIKAWFKVKRIDPTQVKFVIVDDDDDMLDEQLENFVHVDGEEGLSFKNYMDICTLLELDPWLKT